MCIAGTMTKPVVVGTAGWAIPAGDRDAFPADGSALARYSARLDGVEINSSFHRRHRPATWANWAQTVPADFRFAVKLPKTITHQAKLREVSGPIEDFTADVSGVVEKLAIVLVQLPPSLAYEEVVAAPFFEQLLSKTGARIACEPRHVSWFQDNADRLLADLGVSRVAANPSLSDKASQPGGATDLGYWRLHGSPRMYRSAYGESGVADYVEKISQLACRQSWCMFDNTASTAAINDALLMRYATA